MGGGGWHWRGGAVSDRKVIIYMQRSLNEASMALSGWLNRLAHERGWTLKTELYADALPHDQERLFAGSPGRKVRKLIDVFHPSGFIVEHVALQPISQAMFGDVPVVRVDCDRLRQTGRAGCVVIDDESVARTAADLFQELGFTHTAYVRWFTRPGWSVARERVFRKLVKERGCDFRVVDCPQDEPIRVQCLSRWVSSLPKPCAVFAVNDLIARTVVDACMVAGISVPSEVAVLGVDNNSLLCERGAVTISSVEVDYRCAAEAVCGLMDRMLAGEEGGIVRFSAGNVVRRMSTRVLKCPDSLSARAAEFIRLHFSERIGVAETAAAVGCSPATLQRRFSAATGHAVGEEIANVRFEMARRFLAAPGCVVSSVANRCGYDSDSTLRYAFKSRLGLSPRAFAAAER